MNCPGTCLSVNDERRRRLAIVWRADVPTSQEELTARRVLARRWTPSEHVWSRRYGLSMAAVAIILVGLGALAAERVFHRGSATAPRPEVAGGLELPAPSMPMSSNGPSPLPATTPGTNTVPASSPSAMMLNPVFKSAQLQGPIASVTVTDLASSQSAPIAAAPAPSGSSAGRGAWVRAADALERGDSEAADRALAELASGDNANERDAASLARAQNWVAAGQRDRARPVLLRLATAGATPWIRTRAAELLANAQPTMR